MSKMVNTIQLKNMHQAENCNYVIVYIITQKELFSSYAEIFDEVQQQKLIFLLPKS